MYPQQSNEILNKPETNPKTNLNHSRLNHKLAKSKDYKHTFNKPEEANN
jgi:hypothetical protein